MRDPAGVRIGGKYLLNQAVADYVNFLTHKAEQAPRNHYDEARALAAAAVSEMKVKRLSGELIELGPVGNGRRVSQRVRRRGQAPKPIQCQARTIAKEPFAMNAYLLNEVLEQARKNPASQYPQLQSDTTPKTVVLSVPELEYEHKTYRGHWAGGRFIGETLKMAPSHAKRVDQ